MVVRCIRGQASPDLRHQSSANLIFLGTNLKPRVLRQSGVFQCLLRMTFSPFTCFVDVLRCALRGSIRPSNVTPHIRNSDLHFFVSQFFRPRSKDIVWFFGRSSKVWCRSYNTYGWESMKNSLRPIEIPIGGNCKSPRAIDL